ncbi:MAG: type II secretion system protein M [Pseudomonadota bacterium]|jgi:general secretion pathway protein M|nr:MAG: hypothetical protein DIU56_04495 [Pseudomonadota bacterium]
MNALQTWFYGLSQREQRIVLFGAVAAVLILLVAVILPLNRSVAQAEARIARKQTDLAWIRGVGPQLAAMGSAPQRPTSQESLIVIVDRAARESGLGSSLTRSEPVGTGLLSVRLEKAPFDTLVGWLARLAERHGIGVESATVDAAGEPGRVNAGIVLRAR